MQFWDSLTNLAAQLGVGKSKAAGDQFSLRAMSQAELVALYRSDWLGRKIVDAPVFDMLREWRNWHADDKLITEMEAVERYWRVPSLMSRAARLARLYGGSAIIIGADTQRPEMPLTPASLKKGGLKYLTAVSLHELSTPDMDRNPSSPTFGLPRLYELTSSEIGNVRLHPSRVIPFIGNDRLDTLHAVDPWGDSVLASSYDAIHHAALAQTGIAELIHEAKVDVIRIPNLGANFATDAATSQLVKRFTTANTLKSINNMLLLDTQEEWDRKQTSFAGLPDILDRYLTIVAGASDIPATRLLGQSPKGMSSTGESDLRNYYDMLAGWRENAIGHQVARLDQILWLDAIGSIPKDAYAEWRPLWQLTPKEKADIAKTKAETSNMYFNMGAFDEQTFADAVANQLIEDGTYPGLEKAIDELRSSLPREEQREAAAENDNPPANRSNASDRTRLSYRA